MAKRIRKRKDKSLVLMQIPGEEGPRVAPRHRVPRTYIPVHVLDAASGQGSQVWMDPTTIRTDARPEFPPDLEGAFAPAPEEEIVTVCQEIHERTADVSGFTYEEWVAGMKQDSARELRVWHLVSHLFSLAARDEPPPVRQAMWKYATAYLMGLQEEHDDVQDSLARLNPEQQERLHVTFWYPHALLDGMTKCPDCSSGLLILVPHHRGEEMLLRCPSNECGWLKEYPYEGFDAESVTLQ